jgi:hypothetical protein
MPELDRIEWTEVTEETPVETEIEGTRFRVQRVTNEAPTSHPWRLLELVDADENEWADGGFVFDSRESAQGHLAEFMREEGVLR